MNGLARASAVFFIVFIAWNAAGQQGSSVVTTVVPAPPGSPPLVVLKDAPAVGGHRYAIEWTMDVEGDKSWRFRADFAGAIVTFRDSTGAAIEELRRHSHCWVTTGDRPAWLLCRAPDGAVTMDLAFAIVSAEDLPGRFHVKNTRVVDLDSPPLIPAGHGALSIEARDEHGEVTPARLYLIDAAGQYWIPPYAFAYDLGGRCFYLQDPGVGRIEVPPGEYRVRAMRGFDRGVSEITVQVVEGETKAARVDLERRSPIGDGKWRAGDHHTHLFRHGSSLYPMMNVDDLYTIAQAEGLEYLPFMGEDQIAPDARYVDSSGFVGYETEELTRDLWGHICPIGIDRWPAVDQHGDLWPMNWDWMKKAEDCGGAIAFAHPYGRFGSDPFPVLADPDTGHAARELPIDLALGRSFTIDMLTQEGGELDFEVKLRDYFRLLNLGFRVGVSGSTDFHLDQGRQPIGAARTCAHADALEWPAIAAAYRDGRTYATNGPLLSIELDGAGPGDTVSLGEPGAVECAIEAKSIWGIDRVRIWQDGQVVAELDADGGAVKESVTLNVARSGWMLAMAYGAAAAEVMSQPEGNAIAGGQLAISSPVYVVVKDRPIAGDPEAAEYFARWVDAVQEGFEAACERARAEGEPLPESKRQTVLDRLAVARTVFELLGKAR